MFRAGNIPASGNVAGRVCGTFETAHRAKGLLMATALCTHAFGSFSSSVLPAGPEHKVSAAFVGNVAPLRQTASVYIKKEDFYF